MARSAVVRFAVGIARTEKANPLDCGSENVRSRWPVSQNSIDRRRVMGARESFIRLFHAKRRAVLSARLLLAHHELIKLGEGLDYRPCDFHIDSK